MHAVTVRARLDPIAPLWHLLTALAVTVGVIWQLVLVLHGVNVLVEPSGHLPAISTRVVRFLSYFTVQSNILVGLTSAALVLRPKRSGLLWGVLRLDAMFGIAVTGVIYSTLLRGVVELHGAAAITNALLHYVVPLAAVLGWLLFGPRPRISENVLMLSLIWPAIYVAYTFANGAVDHWYPYPFIDVTKHGYAVVIRNGIGLIVLLVGVGALFMYGDHRLPPTAPGHPGVGSSETPH